VAADADNRYVRIRISDNGEGIDPAFLPHMFDRFRQADASASRTYDGLGLGLAIVKQLVELHGGRVHAMSDGAGRGSTLVLELPHGAAQDDDAASMSNDDSSMSDAPAGDLNGVSVLVVDDQADALSVLQRFLEGAAATVRTASSATAALQMLSTQPFDVIVSDIAMPGMDGFAFAAELAKRGIDTPAIAVSASAFEIDVRNATAAGYKAHLSKPIDRAALLATVSRLANGRAKRANAS
jgi:CheY-like chemotaxis protein